MDTTVWVPIGVSLGINGLGVSYMVGVLRQIQRDHDRRISTLEDEKLDRELHASTVARIDNRMLDLRSDLDRDTRQVNHRVANAVQRIGQIEQREIDTARTRA